MDLRGTYPIDTYKYILNTDNVNLYNGTGSAITYLNVTASNSVSSSYEIFAEYYSTHSEFSISSSWTSESISSSFSFFACRSDFSTTSSWTSASWNSDNSITASWASASYTSSFLPVGTYQITSSLAVTASYAETSVGYTGDIMFLDGNTTTSHTMSFINGILKTYTPA